MVTLTVKIVAWGLGSPPGGAWREGGVDFCGGGVPRSRPASLPHSKLAVLDCSKIPFGLFFSLLSAPVSGDL